MNIAQQVCNPSVSQNEISFPASMLWLNLNGNLNIEVPPEWASEYTKTSVPMHTRLTITDSSNTVLWYLGKPGFISGEMQDPEWSTHADYAAFLGEQPDGWDGYSIRISDKKVFKFNNLHLNGTSTPHIWLPDHGNTPTPDRSATPALQNTTFSANDDSTGMADKASVQSFFGTDSVIIAFSKKVGGMLDVFYMNYMESSPALHKLSRPGERASLSCESGLISPDGKWIVFNCTDNSPSGKCEAYLQQLIPTSTPILISSTGADPHWWKDPANGVYWIMYTNRYGPLPENLIDFIGKNDATIGKTFIQQTFITDNAQMQTTWKIFNGSASIIADVPFQGGMNRPGNALVTGYRYAYVYFF
jgi:hypothetical protein